MTDMKTLVIDGVEYEIIDASVRIRMTNAETNIGNLQTGKADNEDIPTNVSDLTNDSGFITSVPVEDVTIDGTSIVSGKIAAIPRATANAAGAVKIDPHTAADAQYLDIYGEKSSGNEVARKVPLLDANNKILAAQLPAATTSVQGALSADDKTKLNTMVGSSGVTAGSYGGYDSTVPAYNIPNVTVDAYGRVTDASNSVLPQASSSEDGYLSADDYARLLNAPIYRAETYAATAKTIIYSIVSANTHTSAEVSINCPTVQTWFYSADTNKFYPAAIANISINSLEKGYYWHRVYVDTSIVNEVNGESYVHIGDKFYIFSNIPALTGSVTMF